MYKWGTASVETFNFANLSRKHDVCGALYTVHQGLAASVQVIKL